MLEESKTLIGLIHTTEGYQETGLYPVSLTTVEEINRATCSVMGFRIMYGRTEDGKVFEFMKAGRFCKRDIDFMKSIGIIEGACSWAFAPKRFKTPQGIVEITKTFELGRETLQKELEWAKAFGMLG
jgi:hypothetical protein